MDVTYKNSETGVYNFIVNFSDDEMRGYDAITSEVKCAMLEYSTELDTPDYEFEYETHHGPIPKTNTKPDGDEVITRRVYKIEFFYIKKSNPEIKLEFNFSNVSGHYKFDKIQLKYPNDLSKDFLDNTAKQIKVIIENLFSQCGKLCINCVWYHWKEQMGFCDYQYQSKISK